MRRNSPDWKTIALIAAAVVVCGLVVFELFVNKQPAKPATTVTSYRAATAAAPTATGTAPGAQTPAKPNSTLGTPGATATPSNSGSLMDPNGYLKDADKTSIHDNAAGFVNNWYTYGYGDKAYDDYITRSMPYMTPAYGAQQLNQLHQSTRAQGGWQDEVNGKWHNAVALDNIDLDKMAEKDHVLVRATFRRARYLDGDQGVNEYARDTSTVLSMTRQADGKWLVDGYDVQD